jgi:hypothetical protein
MNSGWALIFIVGTLLLIGLGSLGLTTARAVAYIFHTAWVLGFAIWLLRKSD